MSKHGFLVTTGGLAAAAAAHAAFAFGLMAAQPDSYEYLAQLAPRHAATTMMASIEAAPAHQAQHCPRPPAMAAAPMPAVDSFRPEQLHKGQITC